MHVLVNVVVILVALLHVYFLTLQMFLWRKPIGLRVFNQTPEAAETSRVLAMNQGFYNGFIAAGLLWSLGMEECGPKIMIFFLVFVLLAGILGAVTANRKILWVQAMPAAIGLVLILIS